MSLGYLHRLGAQRGSQFDDTANVQQSAVSQAVQNAGTSLVNLFRAPAPQVVTGTAGPPVTVLYASRFPSWVPYAAGAAGVALLVLLLKGRK